MGDLICESDNCTSIECKIMKEKAFEAGTQALSANSFTKFNAISWVIPGEKYSFRFSSQVKKIDSSNDTILNVRNINKNDISKLLNDTIKLANEYLNFSKGCLPKNVFQNEIENFCSKSTRNLEGFMEKIFKHTSMKDTFTNKTYKKYVERSSLSRFKR